MKKITLLFIVFYSITYHAYAQWTQVNVGTGDDLHKISFLGTNNIYLSGGFVDFIHSSNGGNSWNIDPLLTSSGGQFLQSELYDIHFLDANTGIATGFITTGNSETILRTTNGGLNWDVVSLNNNGTWPRNLNDILFTSSTTGYAVGTNGRILKTTDAGVTWNAQSSGTSENLKSIYFTNATDGFIVGDNIILKTTTGGTFWTYASFPNYLFNAVFFTSSSTGYALGEDLLKTTDGGANWHVQNSVGGNDICFVSATTGYIAGNGTIYKTSDGGMYWETIPSADGYTFDAISFADANTGWAAGPNGILMKTTNGGGAGIPAVNFSNSGLCIDSLIILTNNSNPVYTFEWQLDGQTFSTAYNSSLTINDGSQAHTISLIANNGTYTDTQSVIFAAQVSLEINLQAGIRDTIICPNGRDTMYVYNSQPNTSYIKLINNVPSGAAQSGNGNTLVFPIGQTTNPYTASIMATRTAVGCGSATDTVTFSVNMLGINTPVIIYDTLLCKEEPLVITIEGTKPGAYYTLKKLGFGESGNVYGTSQVADSSSIIFTTPPVTTEGYYYLRVHGPSGCYMNFTDTLAFSIEETKAQFHASVINATPAEQVNFFQTCVDADNYLWTFSPGASIASSSLDDPSVSFSSPGSTQVGLICWSDNGCYDTLQSNGPAIYAEPSVQDSCWTLVNNGTGLTNSDIYSVNYQLTPSRTGFLTCGFSRKENFVSLYGNSVNITDDIAYMAKYNSGGVLKWMVYGLGSHNYDYYIKGVEEDIYGNIYITGTAGTYGSSGALYFVDNTGDSIQLFGGGASYIMKLDSTGKFLWQLSGSSDYWSSAVFTTDHAGNLIACMSFSGTQIINLNGTPVYTLPSNMTQQGCSRVITKISPNGNILWDTGINAVPGKIRVDAADNIYLTGYYSETAAFYSKGDPAANMLNGIGGGDAHNNRILFLAKYDSSGALQWKIRSYTTLSPSGSSTTTKPYDMFTDSSGNCYISGLNNAYYYTFNHVFDNSDGSATSRNNGKYFAAKVNTNGVCEWLNSAGNTYMGIGESITKKGNEISVIGRMRTNSSGPQTALFTSTNNIGTLLTVNEGDYFIADYDTLGNLLRIIKNGDNSYYMSYYSGQDYDGFNGLFRGNDNSYYLNANMGFYNGPSQFMNFGTDLAGNFAKHATFTKFYESCGVTAYPDMIAADIGITTLTGIHQSTCGGSYDFSNDSIITVELQNFSSTAIAANADIILTCTVNDTVQVIDTLTFSSGWQAGQTITHTLSHPVSLLPNGPNTIVVSINNNNPNSVNNSIQQTASNFSFPSAGFNVSSFCQNDVVFENTSTTPSGTLSYQWMFGDGVTSDYTNPTYDYSLPGTYNVTLIAIANGCTDTAVQQIVVLQSPVVTLALPPQICQSHTPMVLTGGLPAGGTYSGNSVYDNYYVTEDLVQGDQYIYYSYTDPSTGCSGSAVQQIELLEPQNISMYPFEDVCLYTDPFTLSGGYPLGGTYSVDGNNNTIFNPLSAGAGTHDITYTYTNPSTGCTSTTQREIEVVQALDVTLSLVSAVCIYTTPFNLSGGQPAGGTYFGNGVSNGVFNPQAAGTGSVTIGYAYSGCADTAYSSLVVSPCTGINDPGTGSHLLHIYPNPSTGIINLEFPVINESPVEIELQNMLGQLVYYSSSVENKGICKKTIKPDVAAGMYSLFIRTKDYDTIRKIDIIKP